MLENLQRKTFRASIGGPFLFNAQLFFKLRAPVDNPACEQCPWNACNTAGALVHFADDKMIEDFIGGLITFDFEFGRSYVFVSEQS